MIGEFPAQRASDAENVSIWWRHHGYIKKEARGHHFPKRCLTIKRGQVTGLYNRETVIRCLPMIPNNVLWSEDIIQQSKQDRL